MAKRKMTFSDKMKLVLPPLILFAIIFSWMGLSIWLDNRAEQRAREESAETMDMALDKAVVTVDKTYTVMLPCNNPEGPVVNDQEGTTTTTFTCIVPAEDGNSNIRYYTSNKTYSISRFTPKIDYDFCGTYTDGTTGEVMTNESNKEEQIQGKQFRICTYKGDKGAKLITAKAIHDESLQTYAVIGTATSLKDIEAEFRSYLESLQYIQ